MDMANGIMEAVKGLVGLGLGVFLLILFLNLSYQEQAIATNQMTTLGCVANSNCQNAANQIQGYYGVSVNFTKYSGGVVNAYGSNLQLAVSALVLISIIIAILYGVRDTGLLGGFVG